MQSGDESVLGARHVVETTFDATELSVSRPLRARHGRSARGPSAAREASVGRNEADDVTTNGSLQPVQVVKALIDVASRIEPTLAGSKESPAAVLWAPKPSWTNSTRGLARPTAP